MTDYACREVNGTMKCTHHGSRKALYCPDCQFKYRETGCLFVNNHVSVAFGKQATTTRRRGAHRTNNLTGGKWEPTDILDRIIEYFLRSGKWPTTTTAFRDSQALPHSTTVVRHFGSIEEAVRLAQELHEKEIEEE